MAQSYDSVALNADGNWTSIHSAQPGIVSAPGLTVQNVGPEQVRVFFGGASAPTGVNAGHELNPGEAYYDKAGSAQIWARGPGIIALSVD